MMYYIFRLLYRFIEVLKRVQYKIEEKEKLLHVTSSASAKIHPEAIIVNHQGPSKIKIGSFSNIRGELSVYPYGDGIEIGDGCYLGRYSIIRAANSVKIGNNVLIAHSVTIIDTDSHEKNSIERANSYYMMLNEGIPDKAGNIANSPIEIKDYAWISYNVCILKGVTIGEGAIIGAGSVVTHDIPDYCLAYGNPAKVIKKIAINN